MFSGVRLVALFTLLLTAFTTGARADAFADARAVYDKGDLAAARALFQPLAEQGDRESQTMMGHLISKEPRTDASYTETATWYRKAATQGEPVAQFHMSFIAMAYSYDEALDWLRKSAEQDYGISQWMVASLLMVKTKNVPNVETFKWMRRSAEFENESGPAERLAGWYANGSGVEKNLEEAYFWLKIAEKAVHGWQDEERGTKRLQSITAGDFVSAQLAPEKKAEIDRRVAAWKPKKRPVVRTEIAAPKTSSSN